MPQIGFLLHTSTSRHRVDVLQLAYTTYNDACVPEIQIYFAKAKLSLTDWKLNYDTFTELSDYDRDQWRTVSLIFIKFLQNEEIGEALLSMHH